MAGIVKRVNVQGVGGTFPGCGTGERIAVLASLVEVQLDNIAACGDIQMKATVIHQFYPVLLAQRCLAIDGDGLDKAQTRKSTGKDSSLQASAGNIGSDGIPDSITAGQVDQEGRGGDQKSQE
ncbi:hypothetical protein COW53_06360 [bacterium CG17_big_fil_post_rev_8_21_14_2_50_64_8]|nr:MAG: hypothetical protein COW53_06360 [bacterium CG17_big_fil_post_rev_8_21_14_2_50_64_8]PJA73392.1 MAG: hypothetical protein CO151_13600 [bacterium CG_4_9_14_3_um_filter_65_15]